MAWRRRVFQLATSEHILGELAETLEDRYFKKHLTRQQWQRAVSRLRLQAQLTEITARVVGVAPSAKDGLVLATAESAGAAYLVTNDGKFLEVAYYHGIQILPPLALLPSCVTIPGRSPRQLLCDTVARFRRQPNVSAPILHSIYGLAVSRVTRAITVATPATRTDHQPMPVSS